MSRVTETKCIEFNTNLNYVKDLPLPDISKGNEISWNIGLSPIGILIETLKKVAIEQPKRNAFETIFLDNYLNRIIPIVKLYSQFYFNNEKTFSIDIDSDSVDYMLWNFIVKRRIPIYMAEETYKCRHILFEAHKNVTAVCSAIENRLSFFSKKLFGIKYDSILKDTPEHIEWTDRKHNRVSTKWMKDQLHPFIYNLCIICRDLTYDIRQYIINAKKSAIEEKEKKGLILRRCENAYIPPHLRKNYPHKNGQCESDPHKNTQITSHELLPLNRSVLIPVFMSPSDDTSNLGIFEFLQRNKFLSLTK